MKKIIKAGATSQTIDLFIQDSASTTGGGKTGLAYNTASLTAYYRKGATGSATALTLATQTVGGAYSSGGFVEIDATNMPGMYRLDLPNACIDTAGSVSLMLKGASGMAPLPIELQVVAVDLENATTFGLTNLDATVSSRLASASYASPLDAAGTRTALGMASADLDTQISTLATAAALATTTGYIDTEVAAIKAKTDNLPAAPAAVSDIPTATENADALLKRDWTSVTGEAARSVLNALRFIRNKWSVSGTALTVCKEDDATTAWTGIVTASPGADPISGNDPA